MVCSEVCDKASHDRRKGSEGKHRNCGSPDAIGQAELKSVVTLQILNSSGTVLKTIHGAGA